MSISELNHFMTYVLDGWLLFSAGFVGIGFISFVSKRIQEDLEAEALALTQADSDSVIETDDVSIEQAVESAIAQTAAMPSQSTPPADKTPKPIEPPTNEESDDSAPENPQLENPQIEEDEAEAARLKEVAAVSEELAKTKSKQSDTSSVSVST